MAAAFEGLKPGFDYRCRATAISSVGEGPFSEPTFNSRTLADIPSDPDKPTCVALSNVSVKLMWFAPLENGAAITRFEVKREDTVLAGVLALESRERVENGALPDLSLEIESARGVHPQRRCHSRDPRSNRPQRVGSDSDPPPSDFLS